jgi:hypothetical protein
VVLSTPRRPPAGDSLKGRVVVLDLAFAHSKPAGRHPSVTHRLISQLGPRLACYLDHHDSDFHAEFAHDPRFLLTTKAAHGACPELVTPAVVRAAGRVDTIVCHNDFDGLASAAKWLLGGVEPYEGCDDDARAVDTRVGQISERGRLMDLALRGAPDDEELRLDVVELLLRRLDHPEAWRRVEQAAALAAARERAAERVARRYRVLEGGVAFVDASGAEEPFDRTHLLLLGQERAPVAAVRVGDGVTFAAPFESGVNFLELFDLSGGMPTVASVPAKHLGRCLCALGVPRALAWSLVERPVTVQGQKT